MSVDWPKMNIIANSNAFKWCLGLFADGMELSVRCKHCQEWAATQIKEFYGRNARKIRA